jgi:uncharacterized protein (TIGR03437 family)
MMFRFMVTAFALIPLAFSQTLPAFRWVSEVDASGVDSFAGLGVDAQGNTYIAGSTYSTMFPVKAAVQNHLASDGLYRIDGPGSAYAELGLISATSIAVDPLNPNTLYAVSSATLVRSVDGGATFSALKLPSSEVETVAINPSNDQILYAGTFDQGILKSTDGGVTWAAANGSLTAPQNQFAVSGVWIDPTLPNVIFANTAGNFVRSADGGASWQILYASTAVASVSFSSANPGTLYVTTFNDNVNYLSTDHGQTFTTFATPTPFGAILSDPNHPGRLLGSGLSNIYESDDGGSTWTPKVSLGLFSSTLFAADWANGFLYALMAPSRIVRITSDLQTVTPVGPPALGNIEGIAVAAGHLYVAVYGTRDAYVTKLDPSGTLVYSTYFGGSADDAATALTVDQAGNVYVTGTTTSLDFPVTKGVYAATPPASGGTSFLFKLNPDGSLNYSTYFTGATPAAVAVDASGSAYLAGSSGGNLPVTPGAYQTACNCSPISTGFLSIILEGGFITKFNPTASSLIYSTYIGGTAEFGSPVSALAVGPDGSAYIAGSNGISHLNAAGSALLGSASQPSIGVRAMAIGPDGSLYITGSPGTGDYQFQTTAGAFQPAPIGGSGLPDQVGSNPASAIQKMDPQLAGVLAATYFGGPYDQIGVMTFDSAGNVYIGGNTGVQGLPTRTPLQGGFGTPTGFMSELTGDLSTLLFSSYFGDAEPFAVQGVGVDSDGTVRIGGATGQPNQSAPGPMNIWVNSLTLAPPPALRIDSVVNAASVLDGPISAGETIVVKGAGFASNAQLLIGGAVVPAISTTSTAITAVVPQNIPTGAVEFQVNSGAATSNQVLMPVSATSPGVFSQNGNGYGQGYILNKDGTLNTPSNPAAPGDPITIYATGVGPVSFTQGYAVTGYPVNVTVDGFYANGVAAVMGPVQGFPGSVYQITVYVPNPATLVANNPNLKDFVFPPLVGVVMQIDGFSSQAGIAISISQ